MTRTVPLPATLTLLLTIALLVAACGAAADPACQGLEALAGRTEFIGQDEAERMARAQLTGGPAPGYVVDIEGVTASCLTTHEAYARLFNRPGDSSSTPPDTPVWVVEIKGVSRRPGDDGEPWQYVMNVLHAETGSSMEGARYFEPRLAASVARDAPLKEAGAVDDV